jgi:putative pyruvate formate lyase activating enzyme
MKKRLQLLREVIQSCKLCPRECSVDRTAGQRGFCELGDDITVKCALPHHGEEPPISGTHGAGTIFLSSCNLRCVYCQNYQISHGTPGERMDSNGLAGVMLALQEKRCHNIEPVTPTPQLPQVMEALFIAHEKGLDLPLVYNCGGYENPDIVRILEGMVDIYLPDFKFGNERDAFHCAGIKDYPRYAIESITEMVNQVGDSLEEDDGIAVKGILIRHLVLPGRIPNSIDVLKLIKANISTTAPISLMSQYTPVPLVSSDPLLGRRITRKEYEEVVNAALDMGFENIFTQEVDERVLSPDFEDEFPFNWSQI